MRHLHLLASFGTLAAMAANTDQGQRPISAPSDGQIALTAHNNGDGTWSVKRGPDGPVLQDGLPREKALAIVGAPTGPYEPATEQEATAAEERKALEAKEAKREEKEIFASDDEAGKPAKVANASVAALQAENAALKAEIAKMDGNGDGKVGGSKAKTETPVENGKAKNGGEA